MSTMFAKSCTMFAAGRRANVTTIEGIASNGDLHLVQGFGMSRPVRLLHPGMIWFGRPLQER